MRISDWSSDVCSSDLFPEGKGRLIVETGGDSPSEARRQAERIANAMEGRCRASIVSDPADQHRVWTAREGGLGATAMVPDKPERDRKGVGEGKSVSVRVDTGGRRTIKKKKQTN